jgi:nucleoside recognition membrane protein YjiH
MTRTLGSYIAAVIVAYCFGALFISQGNIAAVTGLGFDVTMSQRLGAIVHDVSGMADIYLPLVAVSLLLGLPVAFAVARKNPHLRTLGYVSAGFVALLAMHVIMKAVLGLSGIAPTRTLWGLLAQGVAGGIGGYLFCRLSGQSRAG